jgi:hypothetical protein
MAGQYYCIPSYLSTEIINTFFSTTSYHIYYKADIPMIFFVGRCSAFVD